MDELTVERLKTLKPKMTLFTGMKGEGDSILTFQDFYDIEAAIEAAINTYKNQPEIKEPSEAKIETSTIYMLYITEGVGFDYGSKLIYIGTREHAQDIVGDLVDVGNGRLDPRDFTLEETVSINGAIIWSKAIDI